MISVHPFPAPPDPESRAAKYLHRDGVGHHRIDTSSRSVQKSPAGAVLARRPRYSFTAPVIAAT
jgi:hypothetical protein